MRLDLSMTPVLTVAYDANGNTLADAQGRSYSWDFENRLTQAVNPGVGTTDFRYDPFGRRIQKSGPNGTTNYLYDGMNLLEELDNSGNVLARYTQDLPVDEPLAEFRSNTTNDYNQVARCIRVGIFHSRIRRSEATKTFPRGKKLKHTWH